MNIASEIRSLQLLHQSRMLVLPFQNQSTIKKDWKVEISFRHKFKLQ